MQVRPATLTDATSIAQVHVVSWQAAYRGIVPDAHLDLMSPSRLTAIWSTLIGASVETPQMTLVAEDDGQIVGFANVCRQRNECAAPEAGEVSSIYLVPEHWGSGAGRELMAAGLTWLTEAGFSSAMLWVLADNARARRFYEAGGWRTDGTHKVETIGGVPLTEVLYQRGLSPD